MKYFDRTVREERIYTVAMRCETEKEKISICYILGFFPVGIDLSRK